MTCVKKSSLPDCESRVLQELGLHWLIDAMWTFLASLTFNTHCTVVRHHTRQIHLRCKIPVGGLA